MDCNDNQRFVNARKQKHEPLGEVQHEDKDEVEVSELKIPTFRYKFSAEIMSMITRFAKLHQHDDRHSYKEAWREWYDINEEELMQETTRLKELGYDKNIYDKMYKAGRYYFRKKTTHPVEPKKRCKYTTLGQILLEAMDSHISEAMKSDDFTPASGYCNFCEFHQDIILDEIKSIMELGKICTSDLISKVKKTYKNRYFMISRSK